MQVLKLSDNYSEILSTPYLFYFINSQEGTFIDRASVSKYYYKAF